MSGQAMVKDAPPVASAGYREFVQPGHALFGDLLQRRPAGREPALEWGLQELSRRLEYRPDPGRRSPDEIWDEIQAQPTGKPRVNCISMCCVVASYLRAIGFDPDETYVALGGIRAYPHFHAWVLVRDEHGLRQIEPKDLSVLDLTGEELLRRYRFFALFNDERLHFLEEERRRVILGGCAGAGLHLIVFGPTDAPLSAAISDPELRRVVAQLLAEGSLAAGHLPDRDEWQRYGLLQRCGQHALPGPRLALIPKAAIRELRRLAGPFLDRYLGVLSATVPELRRAYAGCAASRRFSWEEAEHALVAGMLMDMLVARRLSSDGDGLGHAREAVVWAFEDMDTRSSYGVQCTGGGPSRTWFVQLWHRGFRRQPLRLTPALLAQLGRAAQGADAGAPSKEWLYLRYLKLVSGAGACGRMELPAFGPEDSDRLLSPLSRAADRLVDEAIRPSLAASDESPWWRSRARDLRYRHAILRWLLESAADRALDAGLLSPFPPEAEAPANWGRWLWMDPESAPPLIPELARDVPAGGIRP